MLVYCRPTGAINACANYSDLILLVKNKPLLLLLETFTTSFSCSCLFDTGCLEQQIFFLLYCFNISQQQSDKITIKIELCENTGN